jgi:hypothetical protein
MRADRVVSHELHGHLLRERWIQTASDVDSRQLLVLALVVGGELRTLAREVGMLDVRL